MTVEQAVLGVLINNYPTVRNHVVQTAHPTYQMSGLARLRGLKQEGIVSYRFDSCDNTYRILTPREELQRALEAMKRGEGDPIKIIAAMRGFKGPPQAGSMRTEAPPAQLSKATPHPDPLPVRGEGIKQGLEREEKEETTPFSFDVSKLREFRESL